MPESLTHSKQVSTYGKRVDKELEFAALEGVSLTHKYLAIKSHFIAYLLFDFLTADRSWSGSSLWGVGIP